jgi:prevent-host-death family protein
MDSVGAFEAKTHLSDLLDRVSRGEKITITRHGVPVAMLVPVEDTGPPTDAPRSRGWNAGAAQEDET